MQIHSRFIGGGGLVYTWHGVLVAAAAHLALNWLAETEVELKYACKRTGKWGRRKVENKNSHLDVVDCSNCVLRWWPFGPKRSTVGPNVGHEQRGNSRRVFRDGLKRCSVSRRMHDRDLLTDFRVPS